MYAHGTLNFWIFNLGSGIFHSVYTPSLLRIHSVRLTVRTRCLLSASFVRMCVFCRIVVIVIVVNLRLNCLPGVLSWDLGLSNIFGCCLVNYCGGLRKGEPVQSWVHLGKSTMPGCEKGCQIGTL